MDVVTAAANVTKERAPLKSTTSDYVEMCLLSVFFVIAAPLNLYALYNTISACKRRKWRLHYGGIGKTPAPDRMLVMKINLNIADLVVVFGYALSEIIWLFTFQWYGGDVLCRVVKFLHIFGFALTSNLIVCIAVDRVYAMMHIKQIHTVKAWTYCKIMLVIAWILAVLFSSPQLFVYSVVRPFPADREFTQCSPFFHTLVHYRTICEAGGLKNDSAECLEAYESDPADLAAWERYYSYVHLLTTWWAPTITVFCCYALILLRLRTDIRGERHTTGNTITNTDSNTATFVANHHSLDNEHRQLEKNGHVIFELNRRGKTPPPTLMLNLVETKFAAQNGKPVNQRLMVVTDNGCGRPRCATFDTASSTLLPLSARSAKSLSPTPAPTPTDGPSTDLMTPSGQSGELNDQRPSNSCLSFSAVRLINAKNKTLRKAIFILIAYLVCWSPYSVLALLNSVVTETMKPNRQEDWHQVKRKFLAFLNSLIVLNALVNPIIYGVKL